MAFSPDGATLATGHGDTMTRWAVATGRAVETREARHVRGVGFSPDGAWWAANLGSAAFVLRRVGTETDLVFRAVGDTGDAFAFTLGAQPRVQLYGDRGREFIRCTVGHRVFASDLCLDRFEDPHLVARLFEDD